MSELIREPSLLINGEWVPGTGPACEAENPAAALAGAVGDALGAVDRLPITTSGRWELMQQEPT